MTEIKLSLPWEYTQETTPIVTSVLDLAVTGLHNKLTELFNSTLQLVSLSEVCFKYFIIIFLRYIN